MATVGIYTIIVLWNEEDHISAFTKAWISILLNKFEITVEFL